MPEALRLLTEKLADKSGAVNAGAEAPKVDNAPELHDLRSGWVGNTPGPHTPSTEYPEKTVIV